MNQWEKPTKLGYSYVQVRAMDDAQIIAAGLNSGDRLAFELANRLDNALHRERAAPVTPPIPEDVKPMAWLGFPEVARPKYDLIYDNSRRLPGYHYSPIWRPEDHPAERREKAKVHE